MKHLITAVSFAVLAVPAFAAERGAPYDQSLVDRALPQIEIKESASTGATRARAQRGLPFDQLEIDRALPRL
jgi:hypothetical protein